MTAPRPDQHVLDFLGKLESGQALVEANAYRGGKLDRLTHDWNPGSYSGDGAIAESADLLNRRFRDLGGNDPIFQTLVANLVDMVIATGITTVADVRVGETYDDEFNDESDEIFEEWANDEIDIEGNLSEAALHRQAFSEMLETGGSIILRCLDESPSRICPLAYQVLEYEQLDGSKERTATASQNAIRRGVEVDGNNRPVAYWLLDAHPDDPYASVKATSDSVRVPAERVIHLRLPGRPSQTRGVPFYTSVMRTVRDIDNYLGDELTSATIASLFSVVHKTDPKVIARQSGMGFSGDGSGVYEDSLGNPRVDLAQGIVSQVPHDDEIAVIQSSRPNSNAEPFIRLMLLLCSMAGRMSPYRVTRDYSGTTYVAARAARLDDNSSFRPMQRLFARMVSIPIRREWTRYRAATREGFQALSSSQLAQQPRRWLKTDVLYPGIEQIDPEKETDADIAGLGALTKTYQGICARSVLHWRRHLRQVARERKYIIETLGLEPKLDRPSTPATRIRAQESESES
jgi:lambda family phage portal protein